MALLVTALAVGGCEAACGEVHEATEKVSARLISVDLEKRFGVRLAAQFRQQVPMVSDPVVQQYLQNLGKTLVASAEGVPEGMDFEFRVVDAPDTINAVAMPGGYIYVFSGLIRAVDSEAELVGVLAHEIAHVVERHVAAQLVTSLGIELVRTLAMSEEGGQLAQIASELATRGALGAFSRTAEREADRMGVAMVVRAGWDPRGYVTFFERLAAMQESPGLVGRFVSSHPNPAERAKRARVLIDSLDVAPLRTDDQALRRIAARL